eukprot:1152182-Pelagomonas_calceolata.AAC.1
MQLGPHYELISLVYRALGAKVGRNVYWPGTGIGGLGAFDLLEVRAVWLTDVCLKPVALRCKASRRSAHIASWGRDACRLEMMWSLDRAAASCCVTLTMLVQSASRLITKGDLQPDCSSDQPVAHATQQQNQHVKVISADRCPETVDHCLMVASSKAIISARYSDDQFLQGVSADRPAVHAAD